jgi:hypothetical protein
MLGISIGLMAKVVYSYGFSVPVEAGATFEQMLHAFLLYFFGNYYRMMVFSDHA